MRARDHARTGDGGACRPAPVNCQPAAGHRDCACRERAAGSASADTAPPRVARGYVPADADAQGEARRCAGASRTYAWTRDGRRSSCLVTMLRPAWSFDPTPARQVATWGPLDAISIDDAFGDGTGAGVRVAIVDGGIDNEHPAIAGQVRGWVEPYEEGGKLQFRTERHSDTSGHGTACASIVLRLAPRVELYSIKVLGAGMAGTGTLFAAGLHWAIEN